MRTPLPTLQARAAAGDRLVMVTCYDASLARASEAAGVDILLVGDSLGMTVQGAETTLAVSLDDVAYHTRCVAAGSRKTFLLADLPFGSYQGSPLQAFESAARILASGAQMVKVEGGAVMAETVAFLVARGVPTMAHIGLTPQSVHALGGWRAQGRDDASAARLLEDAQALAAAGAGMLLLESIPAALARRITESITIPTVGIGAGAGCSGQVLVVQDLLGLTPKPPRFAKDFLAGRGSVVDALAAYAADVRAGRFPGEEHAF